MFFFKQLFPDPYSIAKRNKTIELESRISVLSKIRFVKFPVEYNFQRKELRIFTLKKVFPAFKTVQSTCQLELSASLGPTADEMVREYELYQPKRGWSY